MKLKEDYIVGFIDGEGTISVTKYPDGRIRPQVLVFNTNKKVLEYIKKSLDINSPILKASRVNDGIQRKKITYRLQIRAKDDVKKVFEMLERHPPIVKGREYNQVKNLTHSWLTT